MSAITIKDVAARAGVSAKTVSRVINGEAHVRDEVRDAVLRVVAELDYRPNAFARGLSSARSFLLGLFFDDPSSGYAADIQRGALARARALSHHLLVEPLDPAQPDWRARLEGTLREVRFGGAILTPPIGDAAEVVAAFEAHGVPVARISPGADPERTPQVRMDDRAASRDVTRHLLALGHRDIGFVAGKPTHSATALRRAGFRDALAEAGIAPRPERERAGDFQFRSGFDAGEALLTAATPPSAIFASNDEMALGVLVAALRLRVAVPERLSVVGFDDAPLARMAWPQLTTIRQPNVDLAAAAVDLLIDPARRVGAGRDATIELPYTLVERESTAPFRAA